jgi:hypothetical protein
VTRFYPKDGVDYSRSPAGRQRVAMAVCEVDSPYDETKRLAIHTHLLHGATGRWGFHSEEIFKRASKRHCANQGKRAEIAYKVKRRKRQFSEVSTGIKATGDYAGDGGGLNTDSEDKVRCPHCTRSFKKRGLKRHISLTHGTEVAGPSGS